jgi:acylphosphatase
MEHRRIHARVRGRVQGVGFRWAACRQAEALGLRGWVRNDDDGTVETVAEGPPAALQSFAAWLGRGPRDALVSGVELTEEGAARGEPSFRIVP